MNIRALHQLKSISKAFSVLYIEPDKNYKKQVFNLLNTLFYDSFSVSNGEDALKYIKKHKVHIIITTLSNAKKCDISMITDIIDFDRNIQIIVLSNYNDNFELLQMIDLNLVDMLLKPLDFDKILLSLKKGIKTRKKTESEIKCYKEFKNIKDTNIKLFNSYKGILINNTAKLINVLDDSIVIQVCDVQKAAIRYQKYTIIYLEEFNIYIKIRLLYIYSGLITFTLPEKVNPTLENIMNKVIIPDSSFKLSIHHKNRNIEDIKLISISLSSLQFSINQNIIHFKIYDKLDLAFAFDINSSTVLVKDKTFATAFATGIIKEIRFLKNRYIITTTFKIRKANESQFRRYLKEQELKIVEEFKQLLKRG